jgi:transketolase
MDLQTFSAKEGIDIELQIGGTMGLELGHRRAGIFDISSTATEGPPPLSDEELKAFTDFDLIYRSLCALMFNYVPMSGHPGGSVSSGRFVACTLFDSMDYDLSEPERPDADIVSYAAGHKALGLYAMWALRNEVARVGCPELLASQQNLQLRLEDLLGFRRNPVTDTPLFQAKKAKPLDGHPTPATPFVRLSTGASGVGLPSSLGLAIGAADYYGEDPPRVHIVEGEGGLTPGRASEALAAAGTASLGNAIIHLDWNQASIDTNRVCRDDKQPGDYVQWTPAELAYLNDWNIISVPDGTDLQQIAAAQRRALELDNGQPTMIVYRTTKGWLYGIEGRASHGAGHKLCSADFYEALRPFEDVAHLEIPRCDQEDPPCGRGDDLAVVEKCYWEALVAVRQAIESHTDMVAILADRLRSARERLTERRRTPRPKAPRVEAVFEQVASLEEPPDHLRLEPGATTTLRGELGKVFDHCNRISGGALMLAAADLLGSTSVATGGKGFADGYWNAHTNPDARLMAIGGICEDAITGVMTGLSSFGRHIGIGSSYGAFIAPLGHIASRLHAIGNQARQEIAPGPYRPFFLVLAHAGLKTGEDGPTHADPQALQLVQENFPIGTAISLTPWDPQEVWHLVCEAFGMRPAIIAPVVTRPSETVLDRPALGLAPPEDARRGLYLLRKAAGNADGTVVLQGSEVAYAFIQGALPPLERDGINLDAFYVTSAELFDLLPTDQKEAIFPESRARVAMGVTGFTLPTMHRWVTSARGRAATLHPFMKGRYLGSGPGYRVLEEAGLDGKSQYEAIKKYVESS